MFAEHDVECAHRYGYRAKDLVLFLVMGLLLLGLPGGYMLYLARTNKDPVVLKGIPLNAQQGCVAFGVIGVFLTVLFLALLWACVRRMQRPGRIAFTANAVVVPDEHGGERLLFFQEILDISLSGYVDSIEPLFGWPDPDRPLHIRVVGPAAWCRIYKARLTSPQAYDAIYLRLTAAATQARALPRATVSDFPQGPVAESELGAVLFECRSTLLNRLVAWLFFIPIAVGLAILGLVFARHGTPAALGFGGFVIAVGGAFFLAAWHCLRRAFRCHEGGMSVRRMFGTDRLRYADIYCVVMHDEAAAIKGVIQLAGHRHVMVRCEPHPGMDLRPLVFHQEGRIDPDEFGRDIRTIIEGHGARFRRIKAWRT
jgi:hypothetical protein